jgi:hypothetical protein
VTSAAAPSPDWHALAAAASAAAPQFTIWKHGDALARPGGDLDATAPRGAWPVLVPAIRDWAAAEGCTHLVRCRHVPGTLITVACGGAIGDALLQVDLVARKPLAAGAWFDAESVAAAATTDARGVRRLPAGAEGLLRLLDDPEDAEAASLLLGDPIGGEAMAGSLALPRRLLLAAAGGSAALRAAAAVLASAQAVVSRRLDRPFARWRPCSLTAALGQSRRASPSVTVWLEAARRDHEVEPIA